MNAADFHILVLDTETTGFDSKKDIITEVGAVLLGYLEGSGWQFNDEHYYQAVDETFARGYQTVMSGAFRQWCAALQVPLLVTTYNLPFDKRFLDRPPWTTSDISNWTWASDASPELCIMKAVKKRLRTKVNLKLSVAAEHFNAKPAAAGYHSALYDAKVAATILREMLNWRLP